MKKNKQTDQLPIDPEQRICPMFDHTGIKLFSAPDREEMGVRVLDGCAEDHRM